MQKNKIVMGSLFLCSSCLFGMDGTVSLKFKNEVVGTYHEDCIRRIKELDTMMEDFGFESKSFMNRALTMGDIMRDNFECFIKPLIDLKEAEYKDGFIEDLVQDYEKLTTKNKTAIIEDLIDIALVCDRYDVQTCYINQEHNCIHAVDLFAYVIAKKISSLSNKDQQGLSKKIKLGSKECKLLDVIQNKIVQYMYPYRDWNIHNCSPTNDCYKGHYGEHYDPIFASKFDLFGFFKLISCVVEKCGGKQWKMSGGKCRECSSPHETMYAKKTDGNEIMEIYGQCDLYEHSRNIVLFDIGRIGCVPILLAKNKDFVGILSAGNEHNYYSCKAVKKFSGLNVSFGKIKEEILNGNNLSFIPQNVRKLQAVDGIVVDEQGVEKVYMLTFPKLIDLLTIHGYDHDSWSARLYKNSDTITTITTIAIIAYCVFCIAFTMFFMYKLKSS